MRDICQINDTSLRYGGVLGLRPALVEEARGDHGEYGSSQSKCALDHELIGSTSSGLWKREAVIMVGLRLWLLPAMVGVVTLLNVVSTSAAELIIDVGQTKTLTTAALLGRPDAATI